MGIGRQVSTLIRFVQVLQVNLTTVFTLCRDVGAHMLGLEPSPITGRRGSVINFASLLSFQGGLTVPAYAASKGAVAQLTKALSNEWTAKGVTVNASKYLKDEETSPEENCGTGFYGAGSLIFYHIVAPGYIETEMNTALLANPDRLRSISERIPAGRWGVADDFKGSVVFLASKSSAYVSGHVLVVDGGWMGR